MCTFQTRSKNIHHEIEYNPSFDYDNSNVILGDPNLISELQFEKISEKGEEPAYRWTSDVTLLFNQQRLAHSLSAEQVRQWLISLNRPSSTVDYSNVSDELIMATIKSRHIQSLSELQAWTNELLENADKIESSINALEQEFLKSQVPVPDSSVKSSEVLNE